MKIAKRNIISFFLALLILALSKFLIDYFLANSGVASNGILISGLVFIILLVAAIFMIAAAVQKTPVVAPTLSDNPSQLESMAKALSEIESSRSQAQRNQAKDDAILFNIGDGLVVIGADGRVDLVNRAFEDMIGDRADEMLGKPWHDVLKLKHENNKDVPVEDSIIKKVFSYKSQFSTSPIITPSNRYFLSGRDGRRIPVQINASPVKLGGAVTDVVCIFRDVTKEIEIEKSKTEFVAIASHQLRTPLATVSWYSEMLMTGDIGTLTPKQREYLNEIYRGNQRMISLIDALLNVSRLEMGAFIVEPQKVNLRALAEDVIAEIAILAKEQNIKIDLKYDDNLPEVDADPNLARIILQNLLTNAVRYARSQIEVSLKLQVGVAINERDANDDKGILIIVRDNGIGIPAAQRDKIFTKLFRADNARRRIQEGTGLGLYIIKSIIDQTSGKIWFESVEDKETAFYILIPIRWMEKKSGTRKLTAEEGGSSARK